MYWAIHCLDRANTDDLRKNALDAHLAYVASAKSRIAVAGLFFTDGGGTPSGSLLIVKADHRDEVEAFVDAAPFAVAGQFYLPVNIWSDDPKASSRKRKALRSKRLRPQLRPNV